MTDTVIHNENNCQLQPCVRVLRLFLHVAMVRIWLKMQWGHSRLCGNRVTSVCLCVMKKIILNK